MFPLRSSPLCGLYTGPSVSPTAGSISWNCRFVMPSSTTCDSVWIYATSSNLRHYRKPRYNPLLWTLERMLMFLLAWSCRSLYTENRFCFLLPFKILQQSASYLNLHLKMCRRIPHYWARWLPTLLILCHPHGCFDAPFSDVTMGDLNVQNLGPKSHHLRKVNAT